MSELNYRTMCWLLAGRLSDRCVCDEGLADACPMALEDGGFTEESLCHQHWLDWAVSESVAAK